MNLNFVVVCMLGACTARADVYYDLETAATSPVWLGATQMVQNTSASHQGTNAIAFTGTYPDAYLLTELPPGTTNVEFYFYDDYGPTPPLYQYMYFWLLEATNSEAFAGFSMLDGGWGTTPPKTKNHYYAWGDEDYGESNIGPIRTIGWHKFTFAIGPDSVAMLLDGAQVFQTNMIRTARYLKLAHCSGCAAWGRMDDLSVSTGTWPTLLCVPPPPGLVSWWQAEGNANDTVGGNSGVLLNAATYAPGRVGQAFSFEGTNSYIRVADNPNLRFTTALTIEAWIYPTDISGYHNIVSKWDVLHPFQDRAYTAGLGPGGVVGLAVSPDGSYAAGTGSTNHVPLNQWSHFAVTYDGLALRTYVNGICEDQVAYNQGIFQGTEDLVIGAAGAYAGGQVVSPFAGRIDEPSVYNRALSAAEIQAIYNAGSAGKCKAPLYAAVTIYSNDFENPVGAEWSTNHRIQTPGGTRSQTWFLGGDINGHNLGFADDTVTLSLTNLAPHSWVEITFDLYVINSWDGISASGPDYFTLAVQDRPVLLHTTFANTVVSQSYPADVGSGSYPSRTGALEVNSLGFDWLNLFGDTVYRITRRVQSSASSIQFQFIGGVNEPDGRNETWGLDNVFVSAGAPPPIIVSQPTNQTAAMGGTATFSVTATDVNLLTYQWFKDGVALAGYTNATLLLTNIHPKQTGYYSVSVNNAVTGVLSANAALNVSGYDFSQWLGLVAYYPFNGNANDESGNGNNGALHGTDWQYSFDRFRAANSLYLNTTSTPLVNLDGTYVTAPRSASFDFNADFTMSAWINLKSGTPTNFPENFISNGPDTAMANLRILTDWGDPNFDGQDGLSFVWENGAQLRLVTGLVPPVVRETWWQTTVVRSGSIVSLYKNGSFLATGAMTPVTNSPEIWLGRHQGGTSYPLIGGIDDVRLYNRALSPDEVLHLYQAEGSQVPAVTLQPTNQFALAGSNVLFAVAATGTQPVSYQWALNGTPLPGETDYALSLPNVSGLNRGFYTVVVTNVTGSVTSTPALLDVRYALVYGNGGLLSGSNYTFIGSVALQLWSVFPSGNIFYTLDGSKPSFASSYYAGPFNLGQPATLRVIAYSADFLQAAKSPPIYFTVIPTYALNLTAPGGGTATASPPASHYVSNTVVTLTPQPSNGWTFLEWRGDACGTNSTVNLTMNRAKTVQAIFGTTLGTTIAGSGAVSVHPALPLYPYGCVARLTAIPQAGSYFAVWGNAASGSTNPLYFTVTSAAPTVSSLFAALGANQYALTVIPDGFGRVTTTPRANAYGTGASVSLNAIPDPGQQFLAWGGDAIGTQNPLPVSMSTSKTITATFTHNPSLAVAPPLGGLFEDGFRLAFTGEFGALYTIYGSTNLLDWTAAGTVTNTYGTVHFKDPATTNLPARFYRAVSIGP